LYKPLLIPPSEKDKDGKLKDPKKIKDFKPTVRVKVVLEGEMATNVLVKVGEENGQPKCRPGTYKDITPGVCCIPIVTNTGLWFMDKQYGMGMQCTDVIVIPKAGRLHNDFDGMDVVMATPGPNGEYLQDEEEEEDEVPPHAVADDVNIPVV